MPLHIDPCVKSLCLARHCGTCHCHLAPGTVCKTCVNQTPTNLERIHAAVKAHWEKMNPGKRYLFDLPKAKAPKKDNETAVHEYDAGSDVM